MNEARIQLDAQVQVRRDFEANWAAVDPVLRDGEFAYSKDLNRIKVGDGARKWSELEYLPGSSASLCYTHIQGEASDVWMIEHNMGRYPSVTVVDSAGSAVFGDVTYANENQLTVTFSVAFSGKAYLN